MSLNVAEGHFEYVIWSNEYLDWANWHEAFEEDYSDASEEKKYQLMSDLNAEYLEDERREMDVQVGTPIIVIADIGRWDGRHTGYREIESGCLKDCLYTELDGVTWYVDDRGDFRMDGYTMTAITTTSTDVIGSMPHRKPSKNSRVRSWITR